MQQRSGRAVQLIVPLGTQVVLREALSVGGSADACHLPGAVGRVVRCPEVTEHAYQVCFADGSLAALHRSQFSLLKQVKTGLLESTLVVSAQHLERFVIYRCIVGSQAYGLAREASDTDRRGIYLPPADLEWSLTGVPEQLENRDAETCYWELKKFITLALKANPNILECLFTPLIEQSSPIADALLAQRNRFLSKLVYQTYNGYVLSQFKRIEQDLRSTGEVRWKHAMHLIRLLLQGIQVLREADVPVRVLQHREALLAIRDGTVGWNEVNRWRLELHREFDHAYQQTTLPDAPDYAAANHLLVWARRKMVEVQP